MKFEPTIDEGSLTRQPQALELRESDVTRADAFGCGFGSNDNMLSLFSR